MGGQERSCLDQPIRAVAVGEADVVADGQVIDARRHGALGELVQAAPDHGAEILLAQDDPHLERGRLTAVPTARPTRAARSAVAVAAACSPNTSAHARPPAYAR